MTRYHVFIQNYADGKIEDKCRATFYSLDDAVAYRDWQSSGSLVVAYIREQTEPEAYGTPESDEERKRRQRREVMRRWRAKKKAQKEAQSSPTATSLHAPLPGKPQECVSVRQTGCLSVCAGKDGKPVIFLGGEE